MKLIKLCYPDLFQTSVTSHRCDFVFGHLEAFMQMYKTQGSTFWLRFLISFKNHTEEKIISYKKNGSFTSHDYEFIKALNYICISLHKKFLEGNITSVKKFIHMLITLALNSPPYLKCSYQQWLTSIKSCKQLHNLFQSLERVQMGAFTAFIFAYTDFFCALCAVFEQWHKVNDLTEEEMKKLDSKIIYWLPTFDTKRKIQPSCFEKYISDYWKENLQRMLLTDNIHESFSIHKSIDCCEKFDKEGNILKVFQLYIQSVHTITEVCMKDFCIIKPQCVHCIDHKTCFVIISHRETCSEPYLCTGNKPCFLTCETKLKNITKPERKGGKKPEKFWKSITIEVFPIDKNKCEASTMAESYNREMQTYLHVKKLSQKNPFFQFNASSLKPPFYRESLFENAMVKMLKFQENFCMSRKHEVKNCQAKCFKQAANSIAVSSANPFGRVIVLSKTFITIPYDLTCNGKINSKVCEKIVNSSNGQNNSSVKKPETPKNKKRNSLINSSLNHNSKEIADINCASDRSIKEIKDVYEDQSKEVTDDDDDIDEILKLIGIGEPDKNLEESDEKTSDAKCAEKMAKVSSKADIEVDNFLKLIGINEKTSDQKRIYTSQEKSNNNRILKICAYCKKKETQRKMFKKCSRCKEENFPIQHYYCSRECLLEDWAGTHEEEHLKFNKEIS